MLAEYMNWKPVLSILNKSNKPTNWLPEPSETETELVYVAVNLTSGAQNNEINFNDQDTCVFIIKTS